MAPARGWKGGGGGAGAVTCVAVRCIGGVRRCKFGVQLALIGKNTSLMSSCGIRMMMEIRRASAGVFGGGPKLGTTANSMNPSPSARRRPLKTQLPESGSWVIAAKSPILYLFSSIPCWKTTQSVPISCVGTSRGSIAVVQRGMLHSATQMKDKRFVLIRVQQRLTPRGERRE